MLFNKFKGETFYFVNLVKMKITELVVEGGKIFYYISCNSLNYWTSLQDDLVLKPAFINLVDLQFSLIAVYSFSWDNVCQTSVNSQYQLYKFGLLCLQTTWTDINICPYIDFKSTPFIYFVCSKQ